MQQYFRAEFLLHKVDVVALHLTILESYRSLYNTSGVHNNLNGWRLDWIHSRLQQGSF